MKRKPRPLWLWRRGSVAIESALRPDHRWFESRLGVGFKERSDRLLLQIGSNPTLAIYNGSAVKYYNTPKPFRKTKMSSSTFEKTL
jgi:hypothetical protein